MPTKDQRKAIEDNRLGLRIVDDGKEFNSGSCYYLFPVTDDWDKRLFDTCKTFENASTPGKTLHLLGNLIDVVSGEFSSGGFSYGRVMGKPVSLAKASMLGNESADAIAGWVLRQITSLVPKMHVSSPPTSGATASQPSVFAWCCTNVAYLFKCCLPGYARLDTDDVDLR
jgi:hypothetical protein